MVPWQQQDSHHAAASDSLLVLAGELAFLDVVLPGENPGP